MYEPHVNLFRGNYVFGVNRILQSLFAFLERCVIQQMNKHSSIPML